MTIEFNKFSSFKRGTMYEILKDAYSFDPRCSQYWNMIWRESDDFFFNHLDIADQYGFITCLDGNPIGLISWDPRHFPEYVEIGNNGIKTCYKGNGYGKLQLQEALRRIRSYEGLKRIIVKTNSNLLAPKNYESVGFKLYAKENNNTESQFSGDFLYYEIVL